MTLRVFVATLVVALATAAYAQPQDYPSRPLTMIVPFSAGGPTDTRSVGYWSSGCGPRSGRLSSSRT